MILFLWIFKSLFRRTCLRFFVSSSWWSFLTLFLFFFVFFFFFLLLLFVCFRGQITKWTTNYISKGSLRFKSEESKCFKMYFIIICVFNFWNWNSCFSENGHRGFVFLHRPYDCHCIITGVNSDRIPGF